MAEFVTAAKLAVGKCEYPTCPRTCDTRTAKEFHWAHVNAMSKLINPSQLGSIANSKMQDQWDKADVPFPELSVGLAFAELAKCILLCEVGTPQL